MSNHHPPPPPYGAMYNTNPPMAPSTQAGFPGMQQSPYHNWASAPYWPVQSPSDGSSMAQNTNGYAHHTNTQGVTPPVYSSGAAQALYAGYPKMVQYNATPPTAYPPMPNTSYAATTHVPQAAVRTNHNPSYTPAAIVPTSLQSSLAAPNTILDQPEPEKASEPELEDGELSSGELSNSTEDLYGDAIEIYQRSPQEAAQSQASKLDKSNDEESLESCESALSKGSLLLGNDELGSRAEFIALVDSVPRPISVPRSTSYSTKQRPDQVVHSTREQAQVILRELQSYKIGIQDISKEGIDADLLRALYAEIGVSVPSNVSNVVEPKSVPEQSFTLRQDSQKLQDPSRVSNTGSDVTTKLNGSISSSTNTLNTPSAKNTGTAKDVRTSSAGKSTAKVPDKSVDRAEYIARMMAAKSGKPFVSSNTASVTSQSSSVDNVNKTKAAALPPSGTLSTPTANTRPEVPTSASGLSQPQPTPTEIEAKRKAQTDLARQKMEALKSQRSLQRQQVLQTASAKAPASGGESLDLETVHLPAADVAKSQQEHAVPTPSDRRQGSFFSPVSLRTAFSIPGLFTTSETTAPSEPRALQQLDRAPAGQSQTTAFSKANESSKSVTMPTTLQTTADIDPAEVSTTSGIGPRKRHKAADFLDSPPTELQGSLSQGEDTGLIIDISDDEASDDYEYLFEPRRDQSASHRPDSAEQKNIGKFPPLSDSTSRRKPAQDLATSTPSAANTPGRVQEPQELKTKEIEIEVMNRKIQEIEQRIQAKKAASRAQSPRLPASPITSQASVEPVPTTGKLETTLPGEPLLDNATIQGTAAQQASLLATQQVDTATEDQLLREKEKQEGRLATVEAEQARILEAEQRKTQQRSHREEVARPNNDDLQRKIQLETEISMLDAEILRSQERLQLSKTEMERIETHLSLAAERKQCLEQELVGLPSPVQVVIEQQEPDAEGARGADVEDNVDVANDETVGSNDVPSTQQLPPDSDDLPSAKAPSFELEEHQLDQVNEDTKNITEAAGGTTGATSTNPSGFNELHPSIDQTSDGELEEDGMDISGSDIDEGQVLQAHQEAAPEPEDLMDITDDDDFYEPPSQIGWAQQSAQNGPAIRAQMADQETEASPKTIFSETLAPDHVREEMTGTSSAAAPVPNAHDDDDYEPPEPESFAIDDPTPPNNPSLVADPVAAADASSIAMSMPSDSSAIAQTGRNASDPAAPLDITEVSLTALLHY